MNVGDILLARLLKNGTEEYGAKGLWCFKEYEAVAPHTFRINDTIYNSYNAASLAHRKPMKSVQARCTIGRTRKNRNVVVQRSLK